MTQKLYKYFNYIHRFVHSPAKSNVLRELILEIADKGLLTGPRSFLHKRSAEYKSHFLGDLLGRNNIVINNFDKKNIPLPYSATPKVSIIIPMYNQVEYTYNCICSIEVHNRSVDYEIIIADDNSNEDTSIISKYFENIVFIKNTTNLGFLKNCNHAATLAKGEYIVFLNNDTQVQQNWLSEMLYVFDNYENIGIVGSKLVYPNGLLQEAGGIIWKDGSARNYGNRDSPAKAEYNYVKEVDYVSGASMMIRKSLWKETGGFDERYTPAYCEDSDLCFQVREKGYKVMYQPFSVVVHFEGVTHGTNTSTGIKRYQVINNKKFYDKWQKKLSDKSNNVKNIFFERDRSKGKKHILILDHDIPTPDKDAGSRTIVNFIDAMISLGYCVKFTPVNGNIFPYYRKLLQEKGVEVLYFEDMLLRINRYIKENSSKFDAILLSRSVVCKQFINPIKKSKFKGKIIYYGHDLSYLRLAHEAEINQDKAKLKLAETIKINEDFMYRNVDYALMCSVDEMDAIRQHINTPLLYIPPYFYEVSATTTAFDLRAGLLFVGGFNHPPNQEAMKWFLDEVYADLESKGIFLTIVGSKMPAFMYEYQAKFKSLTIIPDASIDKLNELYNQTRIAIVPLLTGAGVKGKVIEAMAKGLPIAGTDKAFEGMPKDSNFLYKGNNSASELKANIMDIYFNDEKWNALSAFGKQYTREHYNIEAMKRVLKGIIG